MVMNEIGEQVARIHMAANGELKDAERATTEHVARWAPFNAPEDMLWINP